MLTIHHLYDSRSERLLYCASALGIPHDVKAYFRDKETLMAPPEYKALHPLGTAPVMTDGDLLIAESGAALFYMADKYGQGRLLPAKGSKEYYQCIELLHFVEGSLFSNLMARLMALMTDNGAESPRYAMMMNRLEKNMAFISQVLGDKPLIVGTELSIADIMLAMTFDILQGRVFSDTFKIDSWQKFDNLGPYAERLRDNEHYRYSVRRDF